MQVLVFDLLSKQYIMPYVENKTNMIRTNRGWLSYSYDVKEYGAALQIFY